MVSVIVVDELHTVIKTHSIILYTWCSFSLSYKKSALSIKIQHPANNTWSWAQRQNKDGNDHIQGQRNNQGSLVCNYSDPGKENQKT